MTRKLKGIRIMSRPWKPQDLIDDLQLLIDEEPDSYINDKRTTLCMARDFLKEHFAEPRWISVEERLPEKYKFVLCYKDGKTRIGYYIGAEYVKGVAAFADYSHNHSFGVTHWMPLPSTEGLE